MVQGHKTQSGSCVEPYAALQESSDDVLGTLERGGVAPLVLDGGVLSLRGSDVPLECGGVRGSSLRWW